MKYCLEPARRSCFEHFFVQGALLRYLRNDDEWRQWRELRREGATLDLMHPSGAVAHLLLDHEERILAAQLLEGEPARTLVRAHAAPLPPHAARTSRKQLRRGRPVDEAIAGLGAGLERRVTLRERLTQGNEADSLWCIGPEGSAVEIRESPIGIVASHRWLAHGDALDAFERLEALRKWAVPEFSGGQRSARTWAEVLLFLRIHAADLLDRRELQPGHIELLVNTSEGRRVLAFTLEDRQAEAPLDFGAGTSRCLDPLMLWRFAKLVLSQLPRLDHVPVERVSFYVTELRLAAAAVEQALRFLSGGDEAQCPPPSCYLDAANAAEAARRAEQLSRAGLVELRDYLLELADGWASELSE